MEWSKLSELLNGKLKEATIEERQLLRDMILKVKEFSKLHELMGGDDIAFDQCLENVKYELIKKNKLILHAGEKRDHFYFILEGNCGVFTVKTDLQIQSENKVNSQLTQTSIELRKVDSQLSENRYLHAELQHTLEQQSNILRERQAKLENALSLLRKETDIARIREAFASIPDRKIKSQLNQKYFAQQGQLCLLQRIKNLITGDSIDEVNLSGKDARNTIITLEDTHTIKISLVDYTRLFAHLLTQIHTCQDILRTYFPLTDQETVQQLSYEFRQLDFHRNEAVYAQNAPNPNAFFILLEGGIEIRKYYGKHEFQSKDHKRTSFDEQISDLLLHKKTGGNTMVMEGEMNKIQDNTGQLCGNYYSITIFSGNQVFGTECYGKLNQYSAVSISTETKVLMMDKTKFDAFDHQFNFEKFLREQAVVQNKFFRLRFQQLSAFASKQLEQQSFNKQIFLLSSRKIKNTNNHSQNVSLEKVNRNQGSQTSRTARGKKEVSTYFHRAKILDHSEEPDIGSISCINQPTNRTIPSSNACIPQNQTKNNRGMEGKIHRRQTPQTISKENKINTEDNLNSNSLVDNAAAAEFLNPEIELPQLLRKRDLSEQKGFINETQFDFELDSDKKRRTNILIEYQVSKNTRQTHKLMGANQSKDEGKLDERQETNKSLVKQRKIFKKLLNSQYLISKQIERKEQENQPKGEKSLPGQYKYPQFPEVQEYQQKQKQQNKQNIGQEFQGKNSPQQQQHPYQQASENAQHQAYFAFENENSTKKHQNQQKIGSEVSILAHSHSLHNTNVNSSSMLLNSFQIEHFSAINSNNVIPPAGYQYNTSTLNEIPYETQLMRQKTVSFAYFEEPQVNHSTGLSSSHSSPFLLYPKAARTKKVQPWEENSGQEFQLSTKKSQTKILFFPKKQRSSLKLRVLAERISSPGSSPSLKGFDSPHRMKDLESPMKKTTDRSWRNNSPSNSSSCRTPLQQSYNNEINLKTDQDQLNTITTHQYSKVNVIKTSITRKGSLPHSREQLKELMNPAIQKSVEQVESNQSTQIQLKKEHIKDANQLSHARTIPLEKQQEQQPQRYLTPSSLNTTRQKMQINNNGIQSRQSPSQSKYRNTTATKTATTAAKPSPIIIKTNIKASNSKSISPRRYLKVNEFQYY